MIEVSAFRWPGSPDDPDDPDLDMVEAVVWSGGFHRTWTLWEAETPWS